MCNFTTFFAQYLHHKNLPQLQYKLQKIGRNYTFLYRWEAINSFDMPILINFGRGDYDYKLLNFNPHIDNLYRLRSFNNRFDYIRSRFVENCMSLFRLLYNKI